MSKIFIKNTLNKIKKIKIFSSFNLFKIDRTKVKIIKDGSNIIHDNCGTPNCCGQCETSIKNQNRIFILKIFPIVKYRVYYL